MKITMRFMFGQKLLANLEGHTEPGVDLEKFSRSLISTEQEVNARTDIRLHIWTEPEPSDGQV